MSTLIPLSTITKINMKLRDYQQNMVHQTQDLWNNECVNVLGQLSTGAGKSVIISTLIKQHQGYSIVIAHRTELVSQLSLTLGSFGIKHNIIAPKNTIRQVIATHYNDFEQNYCESNAPCFLASVQTLIKLPKTIDWFRKITLLIIDEAHHVLRENSWGKAAQLFPNAKSFLPTATPIRADGKGLGRHAQGIADSMVLGPPMRQLIQDNYLCDYRIFAPPNDLDLSNVNITSTGEYSHKPLSAAVHKSKITGNIVEHYLRIAPGKRGVTFAVDIKAAAEIALEFRLHGVSAEVISSLTPPLLRQQAMRRFRSGELLQLVNVDILGEGVDVPAIEVISMGRPTESYSVNSQQFGRALRPLEGKQYALIIDHVNNYARHGLPDSPRVWSLDARERRSRTISEDVIPLKTCLKCLSVFTRFIKECPYCGHYSEPQQRNTPEFVDGDLFELDANVLQKLRGNADKIITELPKYPQNVEPYIIKGIQNRHAEKIRVQYILREAIARWAGYYKYSGASDSEIYRRFYFTFNIDILNAQSLGTTQANLLYLKIVDSMDNIQ